MFYGDDRDWRAPLMAVCSPNNDVHLHDVPGCMERNRIPRKGAKAQRKAPLRAQTAEVLQGCRKVRSALRDGIFLDSAPLRLRVIFPFLPWVRWVCIVFLFTIASMPTQAQTSSDSTDKVPPASTAVPEPGTSSNPVLPGVGTVPSLQERRPTSRDPRYTPPVTLPGNKQPSTNSPLFLFSGDLDAQKWMDSQKKRDSAKTSRYDEATYDDTPGGLERVSREEGYLRQFGLSNFPYAHAHEHEGDETPARRFQIIFFISLPITMAASFGILRAAHPNASAFTRAESFGVVALGSAFSAGIGYYDYRQYINLPPAHALGPRQDTQIASAAITIRF